VQRCLAAVEAVLSGRHPGLCAPDGLLRPPFAIGRAHAKFKDKHTEMLFAPIDQPLPLVGHLFPLIGQPLPLVGLLLALIGLLLPLVGLLLALIGQPLPLVGHLFPLIGLLLALIGRLLPLVGVTSRQRGSPAFGDCARGGP